ncbi:MAG: tripartite tricarboxylate transporter substrate binding protein [Pseudomonadota bacterium]
MNRRIALNLAFGLSLLCATAAWAQGYPERPVRLIVPWPPGGTSDAIARLIGPELSRRLGQPVVIDNKAGANGQIGAELAARAPADGYTLLLANADTHSINPSVFPKIRYKALEEFEPVAGICNLPLSIILRNGLGARDLKEFAALAKNSPGKLAFGSWGVGSASQVAMEMFSKETGVSMLHVPFPGAAASLAALMGGQIDAMVLPIGMADQPRKAGRLQLVGVAAQKRFAGTPDVPTFIEQGFKVDAGNWFGIVVPRGTPKAVVDRLEKELNEVVGLAALREPFTLQGVEPMPLGAAQLRMFMANEAARWGRTIKAAHIQVLD